MSDKSDPIRVVIVDDHAVVRLGLRSHLTEQGGITVTASLACSRDLLQWVGTHRADVVLLDFSLGPGEVDGLQLIRLLRSRCPRTGILVVTGSAAEATMAMALRAGASGYFVKNQSLQDLPEAIRRVAAGQPYPPPPGRRGRAGDAGSLAVRAVHLAHEQGVASGTSTGELSLTPREHEVLRCFLAGMNITEIAAKFSRSPKTISAQKHTAFRKLGIRHDFELFRLGPLLGVA